MPTGAETIATEASVAARFSEFVSNDARPRLIPDLHPE
jgi:hypothetical protein